jgi:(p)ppGpp synthase/HD superfamily hydrolase
VNDIESLARAYNFAAEKHAGQSRKGEAGEPYANHLTEVAQLVAEATRGGDVDLVIAAVLHDTVEDTETTFDELASAFGPRVASLVAEVTDDKSLEKAERKRLQIEHAGHASAGAKIIMIADKTSNVRALASSPPVCWTDQRRAEYLDWAVQVVARCRGANAWLEAQFDAAAAHLRLV